MIIKAISDTHGHFVKDDLSCDLLIHSGDATGSGKPHLIEAFLNWFASQPAKYKVFVPGNHDRDIDRYPSLWKQRAKELGIHLLIDDTIVLDDVVIHGSPYTPTFYDWSFMEHRGAPIKRHWDAIPDNCNILITHGPPKGILDACRDGSVGCEELFKRVLEVVPDLHIFGHIHNGYGIAHFNGTSFYNASIMTEDYRPLNKPITIEYERE